MKQFLYFLTLFTSIGTVGFVATNPQLVQQASSSAQRVGRSVVDAIAEESRKYKTEEPSIKNTEDNLAKFLADSPYTKGHSQHSLPQEIPHEVSNEAPLWAMEPQSSHADQEPLKQPHPFAQSSQTVQPIANVWNDSETPIASSGYNTERDGNQTSQKILPVSGDGPFVPFTQSNQPGMASSQASSQHSVPANDYPQWNAQHLAGGSANQLHSVPPQANQASTSSFAVIPAIIPTPSQHAPQITSQALPSLQHFEGRPPAQGEQPVVQSFAVPAREPIVPANEPFDAMAGSAPSWPAAHQAIPEPFSASSSAPPFPLASNDPFSQANGQASMVGQPVQKNLVTTFGTFYTGPDGQPANSIGQISSQPESLHQHTIQQPPIDQRSVVTGYGQTVPAWVDPGPPPPTIPADSAASLQRTSPNVTPNTMPNDLRGQFDAMPSSPAMETAPSGPLVASRSPSQFQVSPSVMAEEIPCHGTEMIARVGTQVILLCDLLPQIRRIGLREFKERIKDIPPQELAQMPANAKDQFLEEFTMHLYPMFLEQQINLNLIYNDFVMSRGKEEIEHYSKKLGEEFDEKDIPEMLKEFGVKDVAELKEFLKKELGSSLERERMLTAQSRLAQQWRAVAVEQATGQCTVDEMMEYYKGNQAEFESKAKAEWQELAVLFSSHANELEAWKKMVWIGNEVARGVPFDEMAKVNSEGFTASKGGIRDWTSKGSLSSKELENAVFTQEIGKLGPIIKTPKSLHIVQVLKREEEKIKPFTEAQGEIRHKIQEQRFQKHQEEYFEKLKRKYPVIVLRESIDFKFQRN